MPLPRSTHLFFRRAGVLALLLTSMIGGVACTAGRFADDPQRSLPPPVVGKLAAPAVGKAGCSATACHGGPAPSLTSAPAHGCWQGSATHWQACDPHQRAYSLLTSNPTRPLRGSVSAADMMKKLGWDRKATEEERCLACHTTPALATKGPVELRSEGVSCSACHGNADAWQFTHTARTGRPVAGMTQLNDLGVRAKTCAGCHVGAAADAGVPVRDVNHDMIAAGHPRLEFDFAEHHRRIPKHWLERDRTIPSAPPRQVSEEQLWFIGRVVHAEATCELLVSRTARVERQDPRLNSPWPEFAEFRCSSCHHHIPDHTRTRNRPRWQSIWPLTVSDDKKIIALRELSDLMDTKWPVKADKVGEKANSAATQLREWRNKLAKPTVPINVGRFFPNVVDPQIDPEDFEAILYGLAARQRSKEFNGPDNMFADAFKFVREWKRSGAQSEKARSQLNGLLTPPR